MLKICARLKQENSFETNANETAEICFGNSVIGALKRFLFLKEFCFSFILEVYIEERAMEEISHFEQVLNMFLIQRLACCLACNRPSVGIC